MQVTVENAPNPLVNVIFTFTRNEDIIELLMFADAARRQGKRLVQLTIPYMPFSRQDRCNNPGEAFSLKVFCDLINNLKFEEVVVQDPHSDVTPALLNNCWVLNQWDLLVLPVLQGTGTSPFYLVAPDAGALKKTYKLAQQFKTPRFLGVIESSKIRDTKTGEITRTVVHRWPSMIGQDDGVVYVIPDDIIDGGRTFIELAKELRKMGALQVHLYATHGFFTKGKQVFEGLIDKVVCVNDYSERVKS